MLQSPENRGEFEEPFVDFLDGVNGVFVLGVARMNGSYTFHAYTSDDVQPQSVPVPEKLRNIGTVSVYEDPDWREYESWLPNSRPAIFMAIRYWIARFFGTTS